MDPHPPPICTEPYSRPRVVCLLFCASPCSPCPLPPPSSLLFVCLPSRSPPFLLALGRCRPGQSALLPLQASREEKKNMADSLVEVLAGDMNVESELDAITEVRAHLVVSLTRFVLLSSLKPSLNFTFSQNSSPGWPLTNCSQAETAQSRSTGTALSPCARRPG